ncbi:hypothetical protein TTHERM_01074530 (macronuclear) [Tetrahymena thermophila SB210]|uniref:Uncharacterized protein n=1 Tax=Tetrahymena thermophila (strain SB210) TaxID=312017 RepID=Q24FN4_TETTS|nr:hypothetical protein TTHERM_01074530 [Tetrahymena thermophila SB210]EAS06610.2 hypothetical protein TTHERM_01074530 [Tetrahymena thermophila SB210]|eukprot:XP_001026855.2 hypothetical protein TTHERM_01074530 [Tetrahymena thermophila SB210]
MNNTKLGSMIINEGQRFEQQPAQNFQQNQYLDIDDRDDSIFPERSPIILDYPLRPEYPAFVKQEQVKDDIKEEELRDKIIRTKKQFKYEKMHPIREQTLEYQMGVEPKTKLDTILQNYEPYDNDFNYAKIEKLSYEYMYDRIDQNLSTFNKIETLFGIFKKKNENLNFFLTDDDKIEDIIDTNVSIVYKKYEKIEEARNKNNNNQKKNSRQEEFNMTTSNRNQLDLADQNTKINLVAQVDTHSQGKDFFFVSKGDNYELVQEYPGTNFIEIRNFDQVGIFKKSDFEQLPIKQSSQTQAFNNNSNLSSSFVHHLDSQIRQQDFLSSQDYSEIINPPKKNSIAGNNPHSLQPGKKSYMPKKTTGNFLVTPSKNTMNSSLIKNSPQLSTTSSKRY